MGDLILEKNLNLDFYGDERPEGLYAPAEMSSDDKTFLRLRTRPRLDEVQGEITLVDLFCGAGGITLGIQVAAQAHKRKLAIKFAADFEARAIEVYRENFPQAHAELVDLAQIFSLDVEAIDFTERELELINRVGKLDVLVGGPPCQGHSDLNNFSRRHDPKNDLYLIMARAAKVLSPRYVVIENVPGAKHDRGGVFAETIDSLQRQGYSISYDTVDVRDIGVPQSRRRLVLVASRDGKVEIGSIVSNYRTEPRDLAWAIKDLENCQADSLMDEPSKPSRDNKSRIDYLFDNDLYDLPNEERPPCHQKGNHSYKSIYGRLKWGDPAQTITSGFYSMCMGRYVHPSRRRTLTAREAARIQFFPDYFSFGAAERRTSLAQIIGNAVPPKLSFMLGHYLIGRLIGVDQSNKEKLGGGR
ncbi:DNA cytosine methyltransferase [Burkholderia territorii]|uniref:DNA cytosine methyltransferase n=1 Tax=Burkholderia territorii TaxID=1503055 RepID=UPI0009BF5A7C|nr:DNA cytosine methyltransferase [Burkholderia territorii]